MVFGWILLNFCLASIDSDSILSKEKKFGIGTWSNLKIFSANNFSRSIYPLYLISISLL
jgi:hypothetical protein